MPRVIYNGGVTIVEGPDVAVAEGIRFHCQGCQKRKPRKKPKVLFAGLLDGNAAISVICSQCGYDNRIATQQKDVPPHSA